VKELNAPFFTPLFTPPLLRPRVTLRLLLGVVGRDAEVVHPLGKLRLFHARARFPVFPLRARRRGVEPAAELARLDDSDAATPDVVGERAIRRDDLQRPPLARRLDQLLD